MQNTQTVLMPSDLSVKTQHIVEALCAQGCTYVNRILCKADKGVKIEELSGCSDLEIEQIINELDQIMSVYGDRD